MGIYVQRNSRVWGPYSAAEVKSQLASGALSVRDPVKWQGQEQWIALGESALMKNGFKELPGMEMKPERQPSGLSPSALGSFLCSLLSLIGGPLATLPGIFLGHYSLHEIKKNPKRTGRKLAITGLVLNYIMTVVTTLILVSLFVFSDQIDQVSEQDAAKTNLPPPLPTLPIMTPPPAHAPANTATNAPVANPAPATSKP